MPARRSDRYGRSVALQTRCSSADATGPGLLQVGLITGTIRGPALGGRQDRAAPSASASQPPAALVPASDCDERGPPRVARSACHPWSEFEEAHRSCCMLDWI
jgi:hypothetical protein